MNYEKLIVANNTPQSHHYREKTNLISSDFRDEKSYHVSVTYTSVTTHISLTRENIDLLGMNLYSNKQEELLFMSFINQRKIHRYSKAIIDYENKDISEEQFEKIEDSCVLSINKDNESLLSKKLIYFYDLMQKYAPEEVKYINNEDLADLLAISEHKINKLHYKIDHE